MVKWLEQLGNAKAEKLGEVMDLFARGIIVPTSGDFPCPSSGSAKFEVSQMSVQSIKEQKGNAFAARPTWLKSTMILAYERNGANHCQAHACACMHDSYEPGLRAGKKFPLEQANEAIAESWKVAKEGKVFLEG